MLGQAIVFFIKTRDIDRCEKRRRHSEVRFISDCDQISNTTYNFVKLTLTKC